MRPYQGPRQTDRSPCRAQPHYRQEKQRPRADMSSAYRIRWICCHSTRETVGSRAEQRVQALAGFSWAPLVRMLPSQGLTHSFTQLWGSYMHCQGSREGSAQHTFCRNASFPPLTVPRSASAKTRGGESPKGPSCS